jgi:hypothetical protein
VRWFIEGKLKLEDGRVRIEDECRFPEAVISPQARR